MGTASEGWFSGLSSGIIDLVNFPTLAVCRVRLQGGLHLPPTHSRPCKDVLQPRLGGFRGAAARVHTAPQARLTVGAAPE
ncbi:hypothetical protein FOA52_011975 [Chlamydomonas sp. UWO 241]|nr:hypothetical protein FOA52_011975 [Chlamydomonas sp. UWO 241]